MGNDIKPDTLAYVLIALLLIIILLFLPILGWMYTDIRKMEIRVERALSRIEGK
jgi:hypothetical protein